MLEEVFTSAVALNVYMNRGTVLQDMNSKQTRAYSGAFTLREPSLMLQSEGQGQFG